VACYVLLVALHLDNAADMGAAAAVLFAVNVTAVLPVTPSNLDATALFVATHDRRGDGHNLRGGRNDHGRGPDRDGEERHGDDNGAALAGP